MERHTGNTDRAVRLGVLGCADIAVRRLLPAAMAAGGVVVTAVASRDGARAAAVAERFGGRPVEGYQALLDRDDVDAVYVPLPPALHGEWIERALGAGKHVLAEKPLTTTAERTERLVASARRAGLVLRENFTFLHHSQHERVRQLLASGAIGELRSLQATFTVPKRPAGDLRLRPDLGGGALLDTGVYPARAALLLLGPDLEVAGAAWRFDEKLGVDLSGAALLSRPDGVTASLAFGLEHAYTAGYELLGSDGTIRLGRAFTPPADLPPPVRLERGGKIEEPRWEPDDQWVNALTAFARDIGEGAGTQGSGPLRTARLVEAVGRAARGT